MFPSTRKKTLNKTNHTHFSDSWYRSVLSTSIVHLQEKGKLRLLFDKWWKEKRGGGACHVSQPFH